MKYLRIMLMAFLASVLAACGGGGDSTATTSAKGTLSVKLTDAPASAYEQVVVTINEVRVHRSDTAEEGDGGWESLDVGEGVLPLQVDLLDLRNGVLASLGDIEPMGEPALHDFVAAGTIGTAAVAGAATDVTLTGGDTPNVVDIPLAEI